MTGGRVLWVGRSMPLAEATLRIMGRRRMGYRHAKLYAIMLCCYLVLMWVYRHGY
jgi:hypothetical protein